jgi:hypothetical protein
MDNRIEQLLSTFQSNGWKFVGSADVSSDWWFSDILQLESTWRPIGTHLYLTLLTDPQILNEKIIWCIALSSKIPDNRNFNYIDQITLNYIKRTDLKRFVVSVNSKILFMKQ